jgi:hypothetical protein
MMFKSCIFVPKQLPFFMFPRTHRVLYESQRLGNACVLQVGPLSPQHGAKGKKGKAIPVTGHGGP